MAERRDEDIGTDDPTVNPGYAAFQLAKGLHTHDEHHAPDTRRRAAEKVAAWETVLRNTLTGAVAYGSRTPLADAPAWVTPEVITGGFATGNLAAGGPLLDHEVALLEGIAAPAAGQERAALNAHFLTEAGLAALCAHMRAGTYDVTVPEEGALLTVAWLLERGHHDAAHALLDELLPFFSRLRFYPVPRAQPRRRLRGVLLQTVGDTAAALRRIRPNERLLAQKEAVEVWAPFHDRVVAMLEETVADGWPCRTRPDGWAARAAALVGEYQELRKQHTRCKKPERPGGHQGTLRALLTRCAADPDALTGRDVGMIRRILHCHAHKRGGPGSERCAAARARQAADVRAPTFHDIAQVVLPRLAAHPADDGTDDIAPLLLAVSADEARPAVPAATEVPPSIRRKVERCFADTVEALVARGLITSGDTIATVLPQVTAEIRASGIDDPELRALDAAVYRAFRRRRSLLLLNLEKQVQLEELPWVAATARLRTGDASADARTTLREACLLTLTSFPHALLPNKLLQELRALCPIAGIDLPLVDELAADIFMGRFSPKFTAALERAAALLDGSLYATYYGIDYPAAVAAAAPAQPPARKGWLRRRQVIEPDDALARHCAFRAGVPLGTFNPATSGMILEQQQILTTQNLAAVVAGLDLKRALEPRLPDLAQRCFTWICKRLQIPTPHPHARLIQIKNSAYAWRQMVFFLALLPDGAARDVAAWADGHLAAQPDAFRALFRPALEGLAHALDGRRPAPFLGWCDGEHWLLPAASP